MVCRSVPCVGASVVLQGGTLRTVDDILHIGSRTHDAVLVWYKCTGAVHLDICHYWCRHQELLQFDTAKAVRDRFSCTAAVLFCKRLYVQRDCVPLSCLETRSAPIPASLCMLALKQRLQDRYMRTCLAGVAQACYKM
jgi:hypothetical protein